MLLLYCLTQMEYESKDYVSNLKDCVGLKAPKTSSPVLIETFVSAEPSKMN